MPPKQAPPIPPENAEEFFTRQLEYYQQLEQYHQQQMLLAREKFNRLKSFLELELPSPDLGGLSSSQQHSEEVVQEEAIKLNSTAAHNGEAAKTTFGEILKEPDSASDSNSDKEDKEIPAVSIDIDRVKLSTIEDIEEEQAALVIERSLPSLQINEGDRSNSVVATEKDVEQETASVSAPGEERSSKALEAKLPAEDEREEKEALKENLPSFVPLEQKVQEYGEKLSDCVAAILLENKPKAMRAADICDCLYPDRLPEKIFKKYCQSIAQTLSTYLNKNQWVRVDKGLYSAEVFSKTSSNIEGIKQDLSNFVPLEQKMRLYGQNYGDMLAEILREKYPKVMRTEDIFKVLYPDAIPEQTAQKYRRTIGLALCNNLGKNLWQREGQGLYRAVVKEELAKAATSSNKAQIDRGQEAPAHLNSKSEITEIEESDSSIIAQIQTLFSSEEEEILHLNYIANKIFGTGYKAKISELEAILVAGETENWCTKGPNNPGCWKLKSEQPVKFEKNEQNHNNSQDSTDSELATKTEESKKAVIKRKDSTTVAKSHSASKKIIERINSRFQEYYKYQLSSDEIFILNCLLDNFNYEKIAVLHGRLKLTGVTKIAEQLMAKLAAVWEEKINIDNFKSTIEKHMYIERQREKAVKSDTNQTIDLKYIANKTNEELSRLAWTQKEINTYLLQTYGKRLRGSLSDLEKREFLEFLLNQPTPNLNEH